MWFYVLMILIMFGGSFIQRVTGFGYGIFAMTFLPYFFENYTEANVLTSILSCVTSIVVCIRMFKIVSWKNNIFPVIGCLVSVYFAVRFMKSSDDTTLRVLLGIVLILLSIFFMFFSGKIHIRKSWYGGLIAGALSGVLNGLFSMGGPPVVIYFMESEEDTSHYLATIQTFFAITNIYSIGIKVAAGFVTQNVLVCVAIGAVGMIAGMIVGARVSDRINGDMMKKCVYAVMAFSGVANIVTSII